MGDHKCVSLDTHEHSDEDILLPGLDEHMAMQCFARCSLLSMWKVSKRWQNFLQHSNYIDTIRNEIGAPSLGLLYMFIRTNKNGFRWFAYDPLSAIWHSLPPLPEEVDFQLSISGCIGYSHTVQCASTGTKLIMVAGSKYVPVEESTKSPVQLEPALKNPLVFDTQQCEWRKGAAFTAPRKWCACGVLGDNLYVASGCGKNWTRGVSKLAEVYDVEEDVWRPLDKLPCSKYSGEPISAVSAQGQLYMVSGQGVMCKQGIVYCPSSERWWDMPRGLRQGWIGPCVTVNGRFFVLNDSAGRLQVYDPEQDCWKLFLEDHRLLAISNLVASHGKICGTTQPQGKFLPQQFSSAILIIDVEAFPPRLYELHVPQGQVIVMQVLSRIAPGVS